MNETHSHDIAIVGGGAAGLAAAIFAAQTLRDAGSHASVVVLDGAKALGAKILVAGGGRCNVTHYQVTADDYNGPRNVVRNVLRSFDVPAAVDWFASMRVELKREETGKLFPTTDSARTVLEALLRRCRELDVEIRTGCRVRGLTPLPLRDGPGEGAAEGSARDAARSATDQPLPSPPLEGEGERTALPSGGAGGGAGEGDAAVESTPALSGSSDLPPPQPCPGGGGRWVVIHDGGQVHARRVIIATGGRSLPRTGSDGGAYAMLGQLGHTVTDTHAALAPLVLDSGFFHAALSGISHEVELSTFADGRRIDQRTGSLLWTHFGVSGPVVMDASRHWVIADAAGRQPRMTVNLLPGESFERVDALLQPRGEGRTVGRRVGAWLAKRVADAIVRHAGLSNSIEMNQLPREGRRRLVHALTGLELPVLRHRGWNYAEVTAGGVPMAEVDYRTMGSRIVDGVHVIGEALDVDGRIGGFNFQWAWATGRLAGLAAAKPFIQ